MKTKMYLLKKRSKKQRNERKISLMMKVNEYSIHTRIRQLTLSHALSLTLLKNVIFYFATFFSSIYYAHGAQHWMAVFNVVIFFEF